MSDKRSAELKALLARRSELLRQAKAAPDPQTRSALFAQASFITEDIREHMGVQASTQIKGNTIDMHGVSVETAVRTLEQTIKTTSYRSLTIITGKGNHSRFGKAKIKPAIIGYCAKNQITCRDLNNRTRVLEL